MIKFLVGDAKYKEIDYFHIINNNKMIVISSNVMIDYDNIRIPFIFDILLKQNPDVIFIQEAYYKYIDVYKTILKDYTLPLIFEEILIKYKMSCLIFVKNTIDINESNYIDFNKSYMNRGIYYVKINDIYYITTHLESMDTKQFNEIRYYQLNQLFDFTKDKNIIIGMDSNLKENIELPNTLLDIWKDENNMTWFGNRFFQKDLEFRFDRFYISNTFHLINKLQIQNLYSDHDILLIQL